MTRVSDIGVLNEENVNDFFLKTESLFRELGMRVLEIKSGYAKTKSDMPKVFFRMGSVAQGGVLMAVMDYTGGLAALTHNESADQVTMELKINFLEPMSATPFICEGRLLRKGGKTMVIRIDLFDANGRLGATGLGTWYILDAAVGPR